MPLPGRYGAINSGVALHEAADVESRAAKEFAGVERVFWVQCPRCRLRLWYALRYDTGQTEIQSFGTRFRQRMLAESCDAHSRAPLPDPKPATNGAGPSRER